MHRGINMMSESCDALSTTQQQPGQELQRAGFAKRRGGFWYSIIKIIVLHNLIYRQSSFIWEVP